MAAIYDRVKVTTATTGTGSMTLGSAVSGYRSFLTAVPSGTIVNYGIEEGTNWELGTGTYTSGVVPVAMFHMEGTNAASVFTETMQATTWTASGTTAPTTVTAQFKFGTTSGAFNGTNSLQKSTGHPNLTTGDFTVEAFVRYSSVAGSQYLISIGTETTGRFLLGYVSGSGLVYNIFGGSTIVFGAWTPSISTWYHMAFVRSGSTFYAFIDGTLIGTQTLAGTIGNTSGMALCANFSNAVGIIGWVDDLRITQTALYTTSFTPPSSTLTETASQLLTRTPTWSSNSDTAITLAGAANVFIPMLKTDIMQAMASFCSGKPVNSEKVGGGVAPYAFTASTTASSAKASVAATASTVFTIKKNGSTTMGTFTFAAAGTTATVSITAGAVSAGDLITIEGPATADATLADISFLLKG